MATSVSSAFAMDPCIWRPHSEPGALRKAGGPGEAASVLLAEAGFPAIDGLASARWQGTPALTRRTRPLADTRVFVAR